MSALILSRSRLHFLLFVLPFISRLPARCRALQLGAPIPQDTLSITVFTGGALALPWTLSASDPQVFDLVLVGVQSGATVFPGIQSTDSPLKLLVRNSPQNYYFRARDNSTGVTLAESSTFEVTAGPTILGSSVSGSSTPPTSTEVLANPMTTQSQSATLKAPATALRRSLISIIVGVVAGNILLILVAVFIWWYRVRRRRPVSARPLLIDDDALSKDGSEEPLLPIHTQLSPFPMSQPAPRMSPLHVPRLRTMSEYSTSSPPSHKSSSYYPTTPASTRRPTLSSQSTATRPRIRTSQHEPTGHYRKLSYELQPPPLSYQGPASPTDRASYFPDPASGYQLSAKRPRMSQHKPTSQYRKLSYDLLLQPASPLSSQAPASPKDWGALHFPNPHRSSTMPAPRGTRAHARKLQVELGTALLETAYEKDEPGTPTKTPTRRRRLRCTSEPLSPESGSPDGHALDKLIKQTRERVAEVHADVPELELWGGGEPCPDEVID